MPFKSKAQAKYLYSKHPEMAEEFEKHTSSIKTLPDHVKKKKSANYLRTKITYK